MKIAQHEDIDTWMASVREDSAECSDDWKGWKGASTETEDESIVEKDKRTTQANETVSEKKKDPYTKYMENPTGNILGERSKEIKKIRQLNQMLQKNPEMNVHQREFVPQDETQSDSEVRSQTTRNQKEEEGVSRLIDQMIERVRKENEESEEENEN